MAAVGRRPCGFQGPGRASCQQAGVACLPYSNLSFSAPSGCSFSFYWGGKREHLGPTKIWKKGKYMWRKEERFTAWNKRGTWVSGPLPSHSGPTSSTAANQTVGIHRQKASPAEGRPSALKGLGKGGQGGQRGSWEALLSLLPAPQCHLRKLLTFAFQ